MPYLLYLFLGILPSFLWLIYFLRKDIHPESKKQITKIFFLGAIFAIFAFFVELAFQEGLNFFKLPYLAYSILSIFIIVGLVEEIGKYLPVRLKVIGKPFFDEPIDAVIYMVSSAMGFAGLENVLLFFGQEPQNPWALSWARFLGATFLHAFVSAIVGFFIALAIWQKRNYLKMIVMGLAIASFLHGLYNYTIIEVKEPLKFYIVILILITLAILVSWQLKKLKRLS